MRKTRNKGLAWALTLCMALSLLPTTALAAAPAAPTNLRIEVGDLYQTLPVLIWDKVDGATTYDIMATDVDGNWVQTNGTTQNHISIGYNTQAAVGYRVIANNENNETSEPATLEGISVNVNSSTSSATAIYNTMTYSEDGHYDVVYHLYTITGLPANATCWLDYKFYDPAENDNIPYEENTKEEWEKEYTRGIQSYEINADGVLVIGMEAPTPNNGNNDWNGLCDGAINPACDEYSLTVTSSSSVSADGKTVTITQQEFALSFAEYSGPANTQSVSFAQSRVDNIEFGTPYTQTATHATGDGSLVYYSMYAAIKKVNPTSGEVVGWYRNENDDSGEITAFVSATANYPAALAIYVIHFVEPTRDAQDLSWSAVSPLNITYGAVNADGPTATNNTVGGSAITYSSSNENVATVNSEGKVTAVGAGACTITATAAETGTASTDYLETSINYTLTVGKKDITVTADNKPKTYGTANPELTFTYNPSDLVSGDDANDLAVTLSCSATTTSLAGTQVSITGISGSANYNVTVISGELTIDKADAPMVDNMIKSLLYSEAHAEVAVSIIGLPTDRGTTSFALGTVAGETGIINGDVTITDTGIKFSTNIGTENQTATIPVTVTMQNYEDVTVDVVVKLVDKTPVTITGVTVANKTYDGAAAAYTGTPANEQGYTGTYEYIWSGGSAPKNAGNYTLTLKIPDDNADFMGEVDIQFAISKKSLTVKPLNLFIYNGAALPTAFTLTYEGLVSGDTITPAGNPEFALKNGADALAISSTNGTYTIEWTNKVDVTVEHSNYNITKADGTLTISTQPSYNGGEGSPSSTPATPTTTTNGNTATTAAEIEAKVNSSGTAVASVSTDSMSSLIESAKNSEKENKSAVIELKVTASTSAQASQVVIPRQSLDTIASETSADVRINTTAATLTFDRQAISAISGAEASGDIQVSVQTVSSDSLPASARTQVGSRPVYDFSVTAGSTQVSSFNGGSVGISIPYTPASGEDINAIVIYYIGDNGELEIVQNGRYDTATGTVEFNVAHFSTYAVGYNKVSFTDVSGSAWYGDAVAFLAARGVTSGSTATSFSPDATLTRGQFITLLMRAYDIDPDNSPSDNFSDAGNTYYTGYLAAAKRLGISNGIVKNTFAPMQAITRQEMFTLLYNALKTIDQLSDNDSGKTLSDFTDSKSISSYAQDAMAYLVETGVVSGSNGKLSPTNTVNRAQMAQVLYNLLSK